ncbi:PadR family transcriptional regulator [Gemmatimonadota bacterium]
MPRKSNASRLYGDLDLLILRTLQMNEPAHGLGIIDAIHVGSGSELKVDYGALYRALYRLDERRLVKGEWKISENNRRARFYRLTPAGRKELKRAQEEWARHTQAVGRILGLEGEGAK